MSDRRKKVFRSEDKIGRNALKIISFFTALFLWSYVLNSELTEIERKIPITYRLPKGKAISNLAESEVLLRLKGARAFIRSYLSSDVFLEVDLTTKGYRNKKSVRYRVSPREISTPFGVELVTISPSFIDINLEKSVTKKIPVELDLQGVLPAELKMIEALIEPKEIIISGPLRVLKKIETIKTSIIHTNELKKGGAVKLSLVELDGRLHYDRSFQVEFKYLIRPKKANIKLDKIKVKYLSFGQKFRSDTNFVSVEILGPNELIDKKDISIVAELPERIIRKEKIKLKALLPEGVHLLRINPSHINVEADLDL